MRALYLLKGAIIKIFTKKAMILSFGALLLMGYSNNALAQDQTERVFYQVFKNCETKLKERTAYELYLGEALKSYDSVVGLTDEVRTQMGQETYNKYLAFSVSQVVANSKILLLISGEIKENKCDSTQM